MTTLNATISTVCPLCHEEHIVLVNEDDYYDWQDGKLAQDAFPYLSADEREMLISGICPDCWSKMWGTEDEDEDLDDCDWGYNEDMGFDPYLGCYTDDC